MKKLRPRIGYQVGAEYGLWRLWLLVATIVAARIIPLQSGYLAEFFAGVHYPSWLWPWGNMDGAVFMLIAHQGYHTSELPFFPLFPLTIRLVAWLTSLPLIPAGMLVSTLAFGGAVWFLYQLLKFDKQQALFHTLFLLMLCYPTGHYYTAVYNDSLFLFLAMGTLFFGRQHRYGWASLWGALAALTRLNGLALAAYLGAEYLIEIQPQLRLLDSWSSVKMVGTTFIRALHPRLWLSKKIWWALLIPGAFVGYLAWIHWQFGDWHLFFDGVQVWHRNHLTFPLQTIWRYFKILATVAPSTLVFWVAMAELAFTTLYGWVLWCSWKRIRFSYWLFMATSFLIPTLTGTLQGMPRYGLHLFPLFLSLALWLESKPKWFQGLWLGIGLVLQFLYLAAYTRGYFVA